MHCSIKNLPQYTTIYSQTFSAEGSHLAVGSENGNIYIYEITVLINKLDSQGDTRPYLSFHAFGSPVFSLISTDSLLIAGTVGQLYVWSWADLLSYKVKIVTSIDLPLFEGHVEKPDANDMVLLSGGVQGRIAVGGGDGKVHVYDIETSDNISTLKAHSDYVHSVAVNESGNEKIVASAGEDGNVILWDIRQGLASTKIQPYQRSELSRPNLGKWVGGIDISSDWLVCGGGVKLALWHLRSMSPSTVLSPEETSIHCATIYNDRIIAAGEFPKLYQSYFNGDICSEIKTSASCTYSIVHTKVPQPVLSFAGTSSIFDLCTKNFSYKNISVNVLPK